jgi:tetratricopeptide (TPR) repeat protein
MRTPLSIVAIFTSGVLLASASSGQEINVRAMQDVGMDLRAQNHPEAALRVFQLAFELHPDSMTLARIAQAEFALGRFAEAEEHLLRVLADARDPWVRDHTPQVQAALEQARAALGSIEIRCNVAGAEFWVDGARYRTLSFQSGPQVVRVRAGGRGVDVRAEGYESQHWNLDLPVGQEVGARINATLTRTAQTTTGTTAASSGTGAGPWILAGLGLAGLGAFGTLQFALREGALDQYNTLCPGDVCAPQNYGTARELRRDAGFYGVLANVSLGIGAATLGGALIWWIAARPSTRTSTSQSRYHLAPTALAGGGGFQIGGTF